MRSASALKVVFGSDIRTKDWEDGDVVEMGGEKYERSVQFS